MAAPLPAALKAADIQRFATRAAQLAKYKPIATYWLEYYILQRILKDSLHTASDEASNYAVQLMDKLEQTRSEYAAEAAVADDVAAKAYMEQFALQTFNRAEEAQIANNVTRQTADTFQAAATFFDSLSIWGALDPESKAKSKFGKFHALRIARALKDGKDPNETNPKVELPQPIAVVDDDEDAELRQLEQEVNGSEAHKPSVESASDMEAEPRVGGPATRAEVSPIDADVPAPNRPVSIGGGYFPSVPTTGGYQEVVPDVADLTAPHIDEETHISRQATISDMMKPNIDGDMHIPRQATVSDMMKPNIDDETHVPDARIAPPSDPAQFYVAKAKVPSLPVDPVLANSTPLSTVNYKPDDEAVLAAQKHAKWAISALNFEDVPTAVKELRIALQRLGGL